jgi:hypothetical protein
MVRNQVNFWQRLHANYFGGQQRDRMLTANNWANNENWQRLGDW